MSYLGHATNMAQFLSHFEMPHVLEIGICRGQTMVPLLVHLLKLGRPFKYVAIDIKSDGTLINQLEQMPGIVPSFPQRPDDESDAPLQAKRANKWNVMYLLINSTEFLGQITEDHSHNAKFDLVLHDGDHNYATLSRELPLIQQLMHPGSMLFVDDYNGRYGKEDGHYANYPGYEKLDTNPIESVPDKAGVHSAVNDWLYQTGHASGHPLRGGFDEAYEPCWIYNPNTVHIDVDPNDFKVPLDYPRVTPFFFDIDPAYTSCSKFTAVLNVVD